VARPGVSPSLARVLAAAAELQRIVPDAVLVGGTAAALHAGHRESFDHDHVLADLADLAERFETILDHLESLGDWSLARASPGKIILGSLGGIETGLRQLIRRRPLEVETVEVNGLPLVVPTATEILRIKAWLAVTRNQTRDYLDIAALADLLGTAAAGATLRDMDEYYADINASDDAVSTQVARQLANVRPRDTRTTRELASYKGLAARWHDWGAVLAVLASVAQEMLR
jgi:hypothetical protein